MPAGPAKCQCAAQPVSSNLRGTQSVPTWNGASVAVLLRLLLSRLVLTSRLLGLLRRANSMSASMVPRRAASCSFGCTGTNREARSSLKLQSTAETQASKRRSDTKPRPILCSTGKEVTGRTFTLMGLCCPQQQPVHGDSMQQVAVAHGPGKRHVLACAAGMRVASSSQNFVRLYTSNNIGPTHPTSLKADVARLALTFAPSVAARLLPLLHPTSWPALLQLWPALLLH